MTNFNLGIWHEGIPKPVATNRVKFDSYCQDYIRFITNNNITRAFFLIQDPAMSPWCQADSQGNYWIVDSWLNKLPHGCEAGFVLDTEDSSPWQGSAPLFQPGDTMEMAFELTQAINLASAIKKVSCIGFDYENMPIYYKSGKDWITDLFAKYIDKKSNDWGWAGGYTGSSQINGGQAWYPELYWVTDTPTNPAGWVGEVSEACSLAQGGKACVGPDATDYARFINDPTSMYNTALGVALTKHAEMYTNLAHTWPMFTVERYVDADTSKNQCVQSAEQPNKNNACGVLDGFGVWDKKDFIDWLTLVNKNNPTLKNFMIYEWNYIPCNWL